MTEPEGALLKLECGASEREHGRNGVMNTLYLFLTHSSNVTALLAISIIAFNTSQFRPVTVPMKVQKLNRRESLR